MIRRHREANLFEILSSSRQKDEDRSGDTPWYRRSQETPAATNLRVETGGRVAGDDAAADRATTLDPQPAARIEQAELPVRDSRSAGSDAQSVQARRGKGAKGRSAAGGRTTKGATTAATTTRVDAPRPQLRPYAAPETPLPATEEGAAAWLNQTLQLRRAVAIVAGVGILLALTGAYLAGRNSVPPTSGLVRPSEEMTPASILQEDAPPKEPMRYIKRTGAPVPGTKPPAKQPQPVAVPEQQWRVDVSVSPSLDGVEKLLLTLRTFETTLQREASVATIRGAKGDRYRVFFGPFSAKEDAEKFLGRARQVCGRDVPHFVDAYVILDTSSKRP
ncbi:MAG: SPOR domain-containing protein [Planctomycetota bacterium]